MADGPAIGSAYLRVSGDFSSVQSQAVALFNSSKWSKLGKVAGAGLAAGLVAGGAVKALYDVGEAFDEASDKITTKTGATGKKLKTLEKSLTGVFSSVPTDLDTASEAVAGLAQRMDLTGKPLTRLSKQLTQLSMVTGTDIKTNVAAVTRLFGDWSIKTDAQRKTLDKLFRLTQSTGIEFDNLSQLMVQFGSPLRQLGFRFDEAAVMFARFEKEGVNMQTLLPGLRFALKNLALPTDELAKSFDKFGISTKDPHEGLLDIFDLLSKDKISEADQTMLASSVFGGRAWADMKAAIEEGRFEFDDLIETMRKGDDTIAGAERRTRDFSEQWTLFKNNLMVAVEPAASKLFRSIGDSMKDVTKVIRDDDLDWGEKWDALVDMAMNALSELVSRAGTLAPRVAEAFAKGFVNAPILGQLALGGFLLKRMGGLGAASALGTTIGNSFGSAAGATSGTAVSQGIRMSTVADAPRTATRFGRLFGDYAGPIIAAGIMSAIAGVKVGHELSDSMTESFSDLDLFTKALADGPKQLRDMVRYAQEHGMEFDKGVIQEWVKAGDISAQEGGRMIEALRDVNQQQAAMARKIAERQGFGFARALSQDGKLMKPEIKSILNQLETLSPKSRAIAERSMVDMARVMTRMGALPKGSAKELVDALKDRFGEIPEDANKSGGDAYSNWDKWLQRTAETGRDRSKDLRTGISDNVDRLVGAVNAGLGHLVGDTNKALKAFGVKVIPWDMTAEQRQQTGGVIVGGHGSGDKVPALLEPGEVVWNREAVKKMGGADEANAVNKLIPRFASGGVVGGDTGGLHPSILRFVSGLYQRFGGTVSSGLRPGTLHGTGQAADYVPDDWAGAARAVNAAGPSLLEGIYNAHFGGPPVSWDSGTQVPPSFWGADTWADHWDHIHIAIADGVSAALSGATRSIKRVMLKGPDGPLKDMGQAAFDKARSAANRYLRENTVPIGESGRGGTSYTGPLDRVFPHPTSTSAPGAAISQAQSISLARAAGFGDGKARRSAAEQDAIVFRESGRHPGIVSFDDGRGLNQMTPWTWDAALRAKIEAIGSYFNPVENYRMAYLLDTVSVGDPWAASAQTGGIVAKLARGGVAGKRSRPFTGFNTLPGLGQPITPGHGVVPSGYTFGQGNVNVGVAPTAYNTLPKNISDALFWLGANATHLDEQIANAETLAGFVTSEMGSDLGPSERAQQVALNDQALANLTAWASYTRSALTTPYLAPDMIDALRTSLADIQGVTGSGGRILQVRRRLDELNAPVTNTSNDDALKISLLEQLNSQLVRDLAIVKAQSPVFAGFRAQGGPIGANEYAIAGERGPEVITGPANVTPMGPMYADIYIGNEKVEEMVEVKFRQVARYATGRGPVVGMKAR